MFENPKRTGKPNEVATLKSPASWPQLCRRTRNWKYRLQSATTTFSRLFDAERVFANFNIDPNRVEMNYYTSGHRLYTKSAVREALTTDIRDYLSKEKR